METMHLIQPSQTADLTTVSDSDLEAIFASAGLDVDVVAHCNTAGCQVCFADVAARAA